MVNGQVIVAGLSENQRTAKANVGAGGKPANTSAEVTSGNTASRIAKSPGVVVVKPHVRHVFNSTIVIIQGSSVRRSGLRQQREFWF